MIVLRLPADRVFEYRLPRSVDLDADGKDDLVVIESSVKHGGALVVYAVEVGSGKARLVELARSDFVGAMRWIAFGDALRNALRGRACGRSIIGIM